MQNVTNRWEIEYFLPSVNKDVTVTSNSSPPGQPGRTIPAIRQPTGCNHSYGEPHDPAIMLNVYPNKFKYYAHTKRLHTNVYNSFIHNHQKPEATKMSFNRWMDTQNIIYWCRKFSLSITQCWIKSQRQNLGEAEKTALWLCQAEGDTAGFCLEKPCVPTWEDMLRNFYSK